MPRIDDQKLTNTLAAMEGMCAVKRQDELVQATLEAALDGLRDLCEERWKAAVPRRPPMTPSYRLDDPPVAEVAHRSALLSIVRQCPDIYTVREAALALLGEVQP